jgi:hypothetical protein
MSAYEVFDLRERLFTVIDDLLQFSSSCKSFAIEEGPRILGIIGQLFNGHLKRPDLSAQLFKFCWALTTSINNGFGSIVNAEKVRDTISERHW